MRSLETLWRAASSVQFKTTRAHWQQMLGDSFRIVEHLLLASDELGSHIPKAGCKWTWYRVVEEDPSTVITMDDETGAILRFPRRDATAMRVNWRLVYKSLCQSLGIELNDRGVDGIDHLRQLGSIRLAAGVELPRPTTSRRDRTIANASRSGGGHRESARRFEAAHGAAKNVHGQRNR